MKGFGHLPPVGEIIEFRNGESQYLSQKHEKKSGLPAERSFLMAVHCMFSLNDVCFLQQE